MEMTSMVQDAVDRKKEKKRRKRRRRRVRRLIFLVILLAVLAKFGFLDGFINDPQGQGQELVRRLSLMGSTVVEHLPDIRLWIADKLNYIAQFL